MDQNFDVKAVAQQRATDLYSREYSAVYRQSDAQEVRSAYYANLCRDIAERAKSLGPDIVAVDFGCGTGRYFGCLENVRTLYAIDLSPHMLEQARRPECAAVRIPDIRFVVGGAEVLATLPPGSIDFFYSIGVLAEHCPLDADFCQAVHRILKPGGLFFFSAADAQNGVKQRKTLKRRLAELAYPLLPVPTQHALSSRWLNLNTTAPVLNDLARTTGFSQWTVETEAVLPDSWDGRHFYCSWTK